MNHIEPSYFALPFAMFAAPALKPHLEPYLPEWALKGVPVALVLVFVLASAYISPLFKAPPKKESLIKPGDKAPDFEIEVAGKKTTIQKLREEKGKPMFIAFVMNSCDCKPTTADIELASAKFKGKVTFLILDIKSKEDANDFKKDQGLKKDAAALFGWGTQPKEYDVKRVPYLCLLDKEGKIYKCPLDQAERVEPTLDEFFAVGPKAPEKANKKGD